jgi:hypothetical protein
MALARQQYQQALDCYVGVLSLWNGSVGAGMDDKLAAASIFSALNASSLMPLRRRTRRYCRCGEIER